MRPLVQTQCHSFLGRFDFTVLRVIGLEPFSKVDALVAGCYTYIVTFSVALLRIGEHHVGGRRPRRCDTRRGGLRVASKRVTESNDTMADDICGRNISPAKVA